MQSVVKERRTDGGWVEPVWLEKLSPRSAAAATYQAMHDATVGDNGQLAPGTAAAGGESGVSSGGPAGAAATVDSHPEGLVAGTVRASSWVVRLPP